MGVPPVPSSYRSSRPRNDPVTPRSGWASAHQARQHPTRHCIWWSRRRCSEIVERVLGPPRRPGPVHRGSGGAAPSGAGRQPVVVGGHGDPLAAASSPPPPYAAPEYGVRSGMPLRTAVRRCPDVVFLLADNPAYEAASEDVRAVLRRLRPERRRRGRDHGRGRGVRRDHDGRPRGLARRIQEAVYTQTRLSCSVGVGDNLLRAKIATEFAKPPCAMTVGRASERASSGSPGRTGMRRWATGRHERVGHRPPTPHASWPNAVCTPCASWLQQTRPRPRPTSGRLSARDTSSRGAVSGLWRCAASRGCPAPAATRRPSPPTSPNGPRYARRPQGSLAG